MAKHYLTMDGVRHAFNVSTRTGIFSSEMADGIILKAESLMALKEGYQRAHHHVG